MEEMPEDKVFALIQKELERQRDEIELIASENYTSEAVMRAQGSVLTNKYAEGYPGKRYYGGCEVVDEIEQLAIDRARELFGAEYANVQPHSGSQANAAVYLSMLQPGDTIMGFSLAHGGHLTHGSPVNFSGKVYRAVFYGVHPDTGLIEMEQVRQMALEHRPKLIIAGASAYSRDWDYAAFRSVADEIGAVLMVDMAHPAGLIAAGLLKNPVAHAHVVTSTTHKTLRGPRGGLILVGRDGENPLGIRNKKGKVRKLSALINSGVFPGMQGGPLEHVIAAKAVAFGEASTPAFRQYAEQVVRNAQAMGKALSELGYRIISGGTDNHMLLIDVRNKSITGKEAEDLLGQANIIVNKNMIPFDPTPPTVTSGIRIGTPAITTRGMGVEECLLLVEWIDAILSHPDDEKLRKDIRAKTVELSRSFPLYQGMDYTAESKTTLC